ncbi:MAG: translocation/assembly module TamB domain-containing protein [Acidobacteriota bacterium]
MTAESRGVDGACRRRPGRVRRWLVRPVVWGLVAVAATILSARWLADSRPVRDWAADELVTRLSTALERKVTLGDISFELFPFSAQLTGLEIGGGPGSDRPFLKVPWALVEADLFALEHRRLRLQMVRLERPEIHLQFFPDGTDNLLQGGGSGDFEVILDQVEVDRARVALEHERLELSLGTGTVRARLRSLGDRRLGGEVTVQDADVLLPQARRSLRVRVAARGRLGPGRLDLDDVRVDSPAVNVVAGGDCTWNTGSGDASLGNPEAPEPSGDHRCGFVTQGDSSGDTLAEIGYLSGLDGPFDFTGDLRWRPGYLLWDGRVGSDAVVFRGRPLERVEGRLRADRAALRLALDGATYAGGDLSGSIDVGMGGTEANGGRGRALDVDLTFDGVGLDPLLADQEIAVDGFASRLRGRVTYSCDLRSHRRGDGRGEITLVADPEAPGLALEGAFPLRIDEGVVSTEAASLRSTRQSLLAGGRYDLASKTGRFDYEIETNDVAELMPLVPGGRQQPPPPWRPSGGRGRLEGVLHLGPGDVASDLRLRLEDVVTPRLSAATARGGLRIEPGAIENLRLDLGDGDQALVVRGRIPLTADGAGEREPTTLAFDAFDWPMDLVRPWLSFELPVDGVISGRLDLEIDAAAEPDPQIDPESDAPTSRGRLAALLAPARIADVPVDALSLGVDWSDDLLHIRQLQARSPSGTVTGDGRLHRSTGELDLRLESPGLDLGREPLARFLPRTGLGGEVALEARLQGRLDDPELEVTAEAQALTLGPRVLDGGLSRAEAAWDGEHLRLDARLADLVTASGGGPLDRDRADLDFAIEAGDLGALLEVLRSDPPKGVGGDLAGRLRVAGDLGRGATPRVDLELGRLRLEVDGRRLRNLEPVRIQYPGPRGTGGGPGMRTGLRNGARNGDRWHLAGLRLEEAATGSELFLTGDLGARPGEDLGLLAQAEVDAGWLRRLLPDLDLGGRLAILGRIGGDAVGPSFDGQARLSGGTLDVPGLPQDLEDLEGTVLLYPDRLVIESLEGRMAAGDVRIDGRIGFGGGDEDGTADVRLNLDGRGLELRYVDGWTLAGDADLSLRSVGDGYLLAGRADLRRLAYDDDIRFDLAQLARDFLRRQRLEVTAADGLRAETRLEVQLRAPGGLEIRNNLADLRGSAQLSLRGTLAAPTLFGELDAEPGGRLVYNGDDYTLERGRVVLADSGGRSGGHSGVQGAEVDLVATTRLRDFDVTLALFGSLDRLETRFSSQPPLPDVEVFRLLAGGDVYQEQVELVPETRADRLGGEESRSAATFLYGQAASVIGNRVNDLFGFDKFRIDPLTGSADNLSKARLTVGKRLSKDLFLTYSAAPSTSDDQRLQIEWRVAEGLTLVFTQNGDDTYSADARWDTAF